jgi:hypothetical protein
MDDDMKQDGVAAPAETEEGTEVKPEGEGMGEAPAA